MRAIIFEILDIVMHALNQSTCVQSSSCSSNGVISYGSDMNKKIALRRSKTQILPCSASMLLHSFEVVILLTFECLWGRQRKPLLGVHETTGNADVVYIRQQLSNCTAIQTKKKKKNLSDTLRGLAVLNC